MTSPSTPRRRWLAGPAVAAALLLGGLAWLASRLPSDEELAANLAERFEQASGVPLRIGAAHWALRPRPVVVLEDVATSQSPPITVRRIVVQPRLGALRARRLAIRAIEVEGAVLPHESVRAFRGRVQARDLAPALAGAWTLADVPLEALHLRDVAWVGRRGIALAYDADVVFDRGWRPREAAVWRPGVSPAARLRLEREATGGDADDATAPARWRTLIDVGGGTWNGQTELHTLDDGRLRITAQLQPRGVDVAGMVGAFERRAAVQGRFDGDTELRTEGRDVGALVRGLHTRTRFRLAPATLEGFDLARVVRTAGAERSGRTVLDELTGTLVTEATDDGIRLRYTGLQARSGVLTARGNATVLNRRLEGVAAIDLVEGIVGVPFALGGTLDAPRLSLSDGALAGAAVGTAVLPGAGTALGARIGQQVEKLLGGGKKDANEKKQEKD